MPTKEVISASEVPLLIALSSLKLGIAFKRGLAKVPNELFEIPESELERRAKPTMVDHAIRVAFWNEVRIAEAESTSVNLNRVYSGICTYTHWYQNVLNRPEKLAWVVRPASTFQEALRPVLMMIARKYAQIISMDFTDKNGKPDIPTVRCILDAMNRVESRVLSKGPSQIAAPRGVGHRPGRDRLKTEEIDRRLQEIDYLLNSR